MTTGAGDFYHMVNTSTDFSNSTNQYRAVKITGPGALALCDFVAVFFGILQNTPAPGALAEIQLGGVGWVRVASAVSPGDRLNLSGSGGQLQTNSGNTSQLCCAYVIQGTVGAGLALARIGMTRLQ